MENASTLDHLLQIEATAAALVNDAQEEADRRIRENESKNHTAYEECFKMEVQKLEDSLKKEKDRLREQYHKTLDEYQNQISGISVNVEQFSSLLNKYLAGES